MFFIKTQGTNNIVDFVQIRDKNFNLVDIVKINSLEKKLKEIYFENYTEVFNKIINENYGKIIEF